MTNAQSKKKSYRNKLLAKIHIMANEQGMSDNAYRDLLRINFGVESAKALSDAELGSLIEMMMTKLDKERRKFYALKEKARHRHWPMDYKRWQGLVRKCCNVDDMRFFYPGKTYENVEQQNRKLRQLLVILEDMERRGEI